jgi:hypothetical protein
MIISLLLCFMWAGHTLLGFCLLTCTFIFIQQRFRADTATIPALQQALPVGGNCSETSFN